MRDIIEKQQDYGPFDADPSTGSGILGRAGLLSVVEVSCICLANHGPFDAALRQAQGSLRDPMGRIGEHSRTVYVNNRP